MCVPPLRLCRNSCQIADLQIAETFAFGSVSTRLAKSERLRDHESSLLCDRCACEEIQDKRMPF